MTPSQGKARPSSSPLLQFSRGVKSQWFGARYKVNSTISQPNALLRYAIRHHSTRSQNLPLT